MNRTYLMGMNQVLELLPSDEPIPHSVVRDMVGARVQILRVTKPIIFCEDSLLRYIASDMLGRDEFEFVTLEGYQTVVTAVSKDDKSWSKIRSPLPHCGIIDRDARDDRDVDTMAAKNVFCFPLYEAESVLLVPEIATYILSKKRNSAIRKEDYLSVLFECAKLSRKKTLDGIQTHLCRFGQMKLNYSENEDGVSHVAVLTPEGVPAKFDARAREIYAALKTNNVESVIRLFDGKALCAEMANRSHAAFKVAFGAHPESDYDFFRQSDEFATRLAALPYLVEWAEKIKAHLRRDA